MPLGRCPDCPRTAPLKRLITDENGNAGSEIVKCKRKAEPGKNLEKCGHFEWLDEYIKRIEMEGASLGLNLLSAVEQFRSSTVGKVEGVAEDKAAELGLKELKKMNKQLLKLVNLKKEAV